MADQTETIRLVRFRQTVLPLQGIILTQEAIIDGYIKEVKIHWPNGCNALVDIRIFHNAIQFCPHEGFLALNDATPTYPFNEYVGHNENIRIEIANTDAGAPHAITVTVTIEGKLSLGK